MWPELFAPHQIGSYNEPVTPPNTEPGDGPLVCAAFNADWLPYVLGSLMQLVNPSSWLVDDEASLEIALERATALLDIFGQAGDCVSYAIRFTDACELQFTNDGGETWTTVDGWSTNFPVCNPPQTQLRLNANCNLQESFDDGSTWPNVPGWSDNFRDCTRLEVGPPPPQPFPPTLPPADQACAIATHLAQAVIRGSVQQAVTSINATDSLIVFGTALLGLIPGVDLVAVGVLAGGAALYEYINAGRISAFNTAVGDDGYFNEMRCRIQSAIAATGYITPANWPTVLAAIGSTPYPDGDVQFAVAEFAAALGFSGANELQQVGTLTVGDCSDCTSWCHKFDFAAAQGTSTNLPNGFAGNYAGSYSAGVGWVSGIRGGISEVGLRCPFGASVSVTDIMIRFSSDRGSGGLLRIGDILSGGVSIHTFPVDPANSGGVLITSGYHTGPFNMDELDILLRCSDSTATIIVDSFEIAGRSGSFGTDNCTYPVGA